MTLTVSPEPGPATRRRAVEAITARLPQWFGIPEASRHYAEQAQKLPGWIARIGGEEVGVLLVAGHGGASAEISWLGADPSRHRAGIGRALVEAAAAELAAEGRQYLFVLTLHPDDPDEPYRRTRFFYESLGFTFVLAGHGVEAGLAYFLKRIV